MCWIFVGLVASIDTCFSVHTNENVEKKEISSIVKIFLADDGWQVSKFVAIKMFLSIVILGLVMCVFNLNVKYGLIFVGTLAIFQAFLFVFLVL